MVGSVNWIGKILRWIGAGLLFCSLIACWVREEGHSYNFLFAAGGIDIILVVLHKLRRKIGYADVDTISQGIQGATGKMIDYLVFGAVVLVCLLAYVNSGYTWSSEDWMWAKKMLPILHIGLAAHLFLNRY